MPIDIKATPSKSRGFYISNETHNIIVNVGRELYYSLYKLIPYGLKFTFEKELISKSGIITHSNWDGERSALGNKPIIQANHTIQIFISPVVGVLIVCDRDGTIHAENYLTVSELLAKSRDQKVLVFYPDTFSVWDGHYLTGLCCINPNALVRDLL